ncbi:MAG: hypothetical protein OXG60_08155 [Chloroflexi bacterium]|nr:hypothetical protein [Chloroflexota bacterium]
MTWLSLLEGEIGVSRKNEFLGHVSLQNRLSQQVERLSLYADSEGAQGIYALSFGI